MTFASNALRTLALAAIIPATLSVGAPQAAAEALLLIEADTGKVLFSENATHPWYPASVTKVMTAYVTLRAVKERRLTLDTPLPVTANAVAQQPSKMGFKAGTLVTVDNALKMLMVKSANDMAVVLAEGVSGSIEKFADEMNRTARRLGMTQTSYVNPNGLPADGQITSARDQAILVRAIYREMPEYDYFWNISAIKFGKRVMRNYNTLIGRYPGADGMKTGFICASGFNLAASATRNGRRLIAVVLGAPSSPVRAAKAAQLLERGFNSGALSWLTPQLGSVDALVPISAEPPNLRDEMCGKHRKRPAAEEADEPDDAQADAHVDSGSPRAINLTALQATAKPSTLLGAYTVTSEPIVVFVGPNKKAQDTQLAAPATGSKQRVAVASAGVAVAPGPAPAPSAPAPAFARSAPAWPSTGSFAPAAIAAPAAPLRMVSVPLPRPRPRGAGSALR
ncbi:MAG: D-alanyl-D-alanine carboxypeptidase family protein [Pseudorhodoplanes sp.]